MLRRLNFRGAVLKFFLFCGLQKILADQSFARRLKAGTKNFNFKYEIIFY
jgi:hypothetical protein